MKSPLPQRLPIPLKRNESFSNEPTIIPNRQPKKRRRKDLAKVHGENDDDDRMPNKQTKLTKAATSKSAPLVGKNISYQNLGASRSVHFEDVRVRPQNQLNASGISSKKKSADHKITLVPSSIKVSNGDASFLLAEAKDTDRLKTGNLQSKNVSSKSKDISGPSDASHQKYYDQSAHAQSKSQSGKPLQNVDELEPSVRQREKNGSRELPNINVFESKYSMQTTQASQGKISKELVNRLMSILGHVIQLRTPKRNLKIMISMGLSAKQEKDDRFQQIKKVVVEMIKERGPSLESKAFELQGVASDDFQEIVSEEKGTLKRKYRMDSALEDKICDLYDLYVDGLDEDAGPHIRELYVECEYGL